MKTKRETAKALAEEIGRRWPQLHVKLKERDRVNTDTHIRGTRLRRPGKGRVGARITVTDPQHPEFPGSASVLLDHRNGETYRRLSDVRRWIEDRLRAEGRKAR